jgi:hypothetical protein
MDKSLNQLEAEVETARAKLAADMALAKSGETRSQFFNDAQQDLLQLKDTVVTNATNSAKSKAAELVETLKAKAAQNPAAVLAIADPLETAKRRAKEQIETAAERARSGAASVTNRIGEKVDEMTQQARDASSDALSQARRYLHDAQDTIAATAKRTKDNLNAAYDGNRVVRTASLTRVDGSQIQDTALLAVAGIAVAASLGLAWQKRSDPVG